MSSVIIGRLKARVVLIIVTHKNIEFVRNSSKEQKYLVKWSLVNILFISTFNHSIYHTIKCQVLATMKPVTE